MWSSVPAEIPAPPGRTKHSVTLLGGRLYLLGGKNGNIPLKDLWSYRLGNIVVLFFCNLIFNF